MDLELIGKTALVTGSSKGIGKSIAETLSVEGCNVMLNSRHLLSSKTARKLMSSKTVVAAASEVNSAWS